MSAELYRQFGGTAFPFRSRRMELLLSTLADDPHRDEWVLTGTAAAAWRQRQRRARRQAISTRRLRDAAARRFRDTDAAESFLGRARWNPSRPRQAAALASGRLAAPFSGSR